MDELVLLYYKIGILLDLSMAFSSVPGFSDWANRRQETIHILALYFSAALLTMTGQATISLMFHLAKPPYAASGAAPPLDVGGGA